MRNSEVKMKQMTRADFSSFQVVCRCPEHYRALLSTSFRENYELNMATYHTGGDEVKSKNITDTCFYVLFDKNSGHKHQGF